MFCGTKTQKGQTMTEKYITKKKKLFVENFAFCDAKTQKEQTTIDIPNTKYITINKNGIFVGGEPATTYNGEKIYSIHEVKSQFAEIQRNRPEVQELHVGAFETAGFFAKPGNPSGKFGRYAWVRVKASDGRLGPWVFCLDCYPPSFCAGFCAKNCCIDVCDFSSMRSAVLKFTKEDKQR